MNPRQMLLQKLSVAQFAAWELHMYLDTHPGDGEALARYRHYEEKTRRLTEEYESKYGPLTAGDAYGDARWEWVNSPWPWETTEGE